MAMPEAGGVNQMAGAQGFGGAGAGRFAGAGGVMGAGGGGQGEPLRVTIANPNAMKQNVSHCCCFPVPEPHASFCSRPSVCVERASPRRPGIGCAQKARGGRAKGNELSEEKICVGVMVETISPKRERSGMRSFVSCFSTFPSHRCSTTLLLSLGRPRLRSYLV